MEDTDLMRAEDDGMIFRGDHATSFPGGITSDVWLSGIEKRAERRRRAVIMRAFLYVILAAILAGMLAFWVGCRIEDYWQVAR